MNILLISYGDLDYDGRLRSLISVFERIGTVYSYTRGKDTYDKKRVVSNTPYKTFIQNVVKYAEKFENIDILVLDNRKATIPGLIIQKKCCPKFVIQDCRELYLSREVKHFNGKVGCFFEKKMVRRADIVICANQERARIMQKEYGLTKEPLTYENLRQLQYESDEAKDKATEKFSKYINDDVIRIISSSGCSLGRTNDVLVRSLRNVNKKCKLFLVGNSESREEEIIRKITEEDNDNEVIILGQVNQTELKYLISRCHIGIVNYGQYDTNNKLCASGKLYEFLYEGIPVVTTTNPPLKRICDNAGVGIADDDYYNGINEIISNYEKFKDNVNNFTSRNTIKDNDSKLINEIKSIVLYT